MFQPDRAAADQEGAGAGAGPAQEAGQDRGRRPARSGPGHQERQGVPQVSLDCLQSTHNYNPVNRNVNWMMQTACCPFPIISYL